MGGGHGTTEADGRVCYGTREDKEEVQRLKETMEELERRNEKLRDTYGPSGATFRR